MTDETAPKKPRKRREKGPFSDELLDQLLSHLQGRDAESLLGESGLVGQLKKQLMERMLAGELTQHLRSEAEAAGGASGNHRNGTSPKTVTAGEDTLALNIPRDRLSTFDPILVAKHQRRLPKFDDRVISMYARGMTVREIQGHLQEIYGLEVSPELISTITDEVIEEVTRWQARPLEAMYPIVYFDALRLKIRDGGTVKNKAVYLALGIDARGYKEVLGIWIEQSEGAKFWLRVFNELRTRGLEDVLIAVVDGLRGFPDAIQTVFPQAQIQTCVVHLIRNSLGHVGWKDRKALAADLKPIYQAPNALAAEDALEVFEKSRWGRWPAIAQAWRRQWPQVVPFFAYPPEVRLILYSTNAIESLHMQVRKIVKNRGHFPNDDAARKLLFLALRNIAKKWTIMPHRFWRPAANQFTIMFGPRFTRPETDL